MKSFNDIKRQELCSTIGNYLRAISTGLTKLDRSISAKMTFDYILSQKKFVLDKEILGERFINTMKDKLIELHHHQNIPWAYNVYLLLFNETIPGVQWGDD